MNGFAVQRRLCASMGNSLPELGVAHCSPDLTPGDFWLSLALLEEVCVCAKGQNFEGD
jgi:hypothetical protein